eukprot:c18727_g1_i5.p1 GENE.c18727_g1_i5~~c18727_g1_i5.p1  ORF type:complete len:591 (+),score=149.92 c18727_g1_i5:37-1773(+)
MAGRFDHTTALVGKDVVELLHKSRVLVVGAGGIGCELLKNLVMTGFHNIEIIDLDTIDVSNLNRQFLFRRKHVGQPKAVVACEAVKAFNPEAVVKAYHGDIKHPQFGASFFEGFDLVMNALDNISARMHVNRMCLSTNIPLIESGTRGYLGQVQVIKKGVTECYECTAKAVPKQPPVCTIRNTPSTMVHCVFWAKYLFGLLYGEKDDTNALSDGADQKPPSTPEDVFEKYFITDVESLLQMHDLWKTRTAPTPLPRTAIAEANHTDAETVKLVEQYDDGTVWDLAQNTAAFLTRAARLFEAALVSPLSFDKDNALAMDFVCAASNLRAACFHIDQQSRFKLKEIAGNIVPAIATTNAIVAGLMVTESIKVLQGRLGDTRFVYCNRHPTGKNLLQALPHHPPNPKCYVCSSRVVRLGIDTNKRSLKFVIEEVLKSHFGLVEPTVTKGTSQLYEEGDDLDPEDVERFQQVTARSLADLGTTNGLLTCESLRQSVKLELAILHREEEDDEFTLLGDDVGQGQPAAAQDEPTHANNNEDDDGTVIVVNKKRKRSEDLDEEAGNAKRQRQIDQIDENAIVIDE